MSDLAILLTGLAFGGLIGAAIGESYGWRRAIRSVQAMPLDYRDPEDWRSPDPVAPIEERDEECTCTQTDVDQLDARGCRAHGGR
jgi:hypothetical protein